ncbi:MAG: hypothetical protein GY842_22450 [bacterium]|nr:hypothetical protein [bacterium]
MRCRKAQLWISARCDGELDASRQGALESHLGSCLVCQAFADDLGRVDRALDLLPAEEPRGGYSGRVMARIEALEQPPDRLRWWSDYLRPAPLGLGTVAFCAGVVLVILANGFVPLDQEPRRDAVAYLADEYLGLQTPPTVEDELISLLPRSED